MQFTDHTIHPFKGCNWWFLVYSQSCTAITISWTFSLTPQITPCPLAVTPSSPSPGVLHLSQTSSKDHRNDITLLMISSLISRPQCPWLSWGSGYLLPGGSRGIALWETPVQMTKGDILVAIIKHLSIWTQLFKNRVLIFSFFFFPGTIPEMEEKFSKLPAKSLACKTIFPWPSSPPLAPLPLLALSKLWAFSWPQLTRSPPGSDIVPHFLNILSVCAFLNTHQSWIPPYFC